MRVARCMELSVFWLMSDRNIQRIWSIEPEAILSIYAAGSVIVVSISFPPFDSKRVFS